MADCIEAMEQAFAEEARGVAVNRPRTRYKVPPDLDKAGYMANIISGAVPSFGVAALRYDSTIVREEKRGWISLRDLSVLNNRETAIQNRQRELLDLIDEGKIGWDLDNFISMT
jgi:hypothetical protein